MIYFTSDLHLCHNKEFLYGDRGFTNPIDMNEVLIKNINDIVKEDDILYILGDLMLSDTDTGIEYMNKINCKDIRLIRGNHDSDDRVARYKNEIKNITSIDYSILFKYNKIMFYLSHYPSVTRQPDDLPNKQGIINLYGHTHQKNMFYNDNFYMYHVGLDSNGLKPISIDEIIENINKEKERYNNEKCA